MCDWVTGLVSFEKVSVYVRLLPWTVAWKEPVPSVSMGGTSLKPERLAANVLAPSSAVATVMVSPITAQAASRRRAHGRLMPLLPSPRGARWGIRMGHLLHPVTFPFT